MGNATFSRMASMAGAQHPLPILRGLTPYKCLPWAAPSTLQPDPEGMRLLPCVQLVAREVWTAQFKIYYGMYYV
jgi:hypothetical protein